MEVNLKKMKGNLMKKYVVEENLVQGILDYLTQRPYKEVFRLIGAFGSLKEFVEPLVRKDEPKIKVPEPESNGLDIEAKAS